MLYDKEPSTIGIGLEFRNVDGVTGLFDFNWNR